MADFDPGTKLTMIILANLFTVEQNSVGISAVMLVTFYRRSGPDLAGGGPGAQLTWGH